LGFITHPNQLTWYTPEEFNVYPSFYSSATSGANGEQEYNNVSPFSDNRNDFMPAYLQSLKPNWGKYLCELPSASTSYMLTKIKEIWKHISEVTRAQMPPFRKYKFSAKKTDAKDMAHPPKHGKVPEGHCTGCWWHHDVCHEVLFGEFCIANVTMYYDMNREDMDVDGINAVYKTTYNQALWFKQYKEVKILDY
jgi:hypothetical protein